MSNDEKIEKLEHDLEESKKESIIQNDSWKNNNIDKYMIKLVYPGIFSIINDPVAGFPKKKRKIAEQINQGQYMFIYVTSPIKRIIGLTKVKSKLKENLESDWPYYVDLEWVIKPREGVAFNDCGLYIRPRAGDTLYSITESVAKDIINKLNMQKELDNNTLINYANEFKDR